MLKSKGTTSIAVLAERAGMRSLSIAWIMPFVACYFVSLVSSINFGCKRKAYDVRTDDVRVKVQRQSFPGQRSADTLRELVFSLLVS